MVEQQLQNSPSASYLKSYDHGSIPSYANSPFKPKNNKTNNKGNTSRYMRNSPAINNDFLVEYKQSILSRVSHLKSHYRKASDERSGSFERGNQDSSQFDTIR